MSCLASQFNKVQKTNTAQRVISTEQGQCSENRVVLKKEMSYIDTLTDFCVSLSATERRAFTWDGKDGSTEKAGSEQDSGRPSPIPLSNLGFFSDLGQFVFFIQQLNLIWLV